jgi:UDP-N-acetylmuramyl pentapeptide phosphotransferase/UDP-N-acetylglucosamine-1-phosphate transferase
MLDFFVLSISFIATIFLTYGYIVFCKKKKYLLKKDSYNRENIVNSSGVLIIIFLLSISIFFADSEDIKKIIIDNIPQPLVFLLSASVLFFIGYLDDIRPIDFRIRLFVQFSAIFFSISLIEIDFFPQIPLKIKQYCIIIIWVYLINVYNFIDGLDGFLILNFLNAIIIILINFNFENTLYPSTILAFYISPIIITLFLFNFPKAKLFVGDSGSYLMGFIIGYFVIEFIKNEKYYLAFLITSYPITDITITIIKKIYKKKKPWDRMFDYFFLKPVLKFNLKHTYSTIPYMFYITANYIILYMFYYKSKISNIYLFLFNILTIFLLIAFFCRPNFFSKKL